MGHSTARVIMDWVASIAMIGIAIFIVAERSPLRDATEVGASSARDAIPRDPIVIRHAASIGSRQASTAAILFVDFQCPYSRKFAVDVWPRFYQDYVEPGKVLFALHHLPLPIHRDATEAAVGAECAGQQRKLLAMQEVLFNAPSDQLSVEHVRRFGHSFVMDRAKFDECLVGSGRANVNQDVATAAEWGVRGTPTMFFGELDSSQRVRVDFRLDGLPTFERLARSLERRYGM